MGNFSARVLVASSIGPENLEAVITIASMAKPVAVDERRSESIEVDDDVLCIGRGRVIIASPDWPEHVFERTFSQIVAVQPVIFIEEPINSPDIVVYITQQTRANVANDSVGRYEKVGVGVVSHCCLQYVVKQWTHFELEVSIVDRIKRNVSLRHGVVNEKLENHTYYLAFTKLNTGF